MHALDYLRAAGPHPEHLDKLMLYGQFVGSWDVVSTWFTTGGGHRQALGEWHFAWVLGGRGVQDVLFRTGSEPATFGTTLRCYDPALDAWHITWMQPSGGEFAHLIGRAVGPDIVQEGSGLRSGAQERWTFTNITSDSFLWRGEVSPDNGQSWMLEQEMSARRRR